MMGTSKYKLNNEVFTGERGFWTQNKVEEEMQQCLFFYRFRLFYYQNKSLVINIQDGLSRTDENILSVAGFCSFPGIPLGIPNFHWSFLAI